jgi:hypothetical protein
MTVTNVSSASLKIGLDICTTTLQSGGSSASISLDVSVAIIQPGLAGAEPVRAPDFVSDFQVVRRCKGTISSLEVCFCP